MPGFLNCPKKLLVMVYNLIFISTIVAFITIKLKDISLRQNLNDDKERRLLLSGGLVILFLMSSAVLPFPESLYWFFVLGILFTICLISFDIVKMEWRRFLKLEKKKQVINVLFYSLLVVFTTIFI